VSSQIISRQLNSREIQADSDDVIAYVPMPPGTKLNNVWLDVSVQSTGSTAIQSACLYGLSGFVIDVDEPDNATSYDHLWDSMVTKDIAESYNILSIDTGTADTNPEFDTGMLDLYQIFGTNLVGNMQIYQKRELLTYPKRPVGYDPSNDTWIPQDAFKVHVRNGPTVRTPSVALFGFSSPGNTTIATGAGDLGNSPTEPEWIFTMYAEVFLYDMWKHLLGMTPSSSTNPFDAVSGWFAKLLESAVVQYETNDFIAPDYKVHTKATWDISVIGKPKKAVLTSD
jgi:hypothetical protein